MMRIALVLPYYEDAAMLARQYRELSTWPAETLAGWELVIVDDGSPSRPALEVSRPGSLPPTRIFRVLEDLLWNQHGARNLGARVARADWLLLTDCDHTVPAGTAAQLLELVRRERLRAGVAYMLPRLEGSSGQPTLNRHGQPKPHPNTFLLTRDLYWQTGGYDEAYRGVYGTDALFRRRLPELKTLAGHPIIRWSEEMTGDERHSLPRKEGRRPGQRAEVARRKAERGEVDRVETLNFSWRQVL